MRVYTVHLRRQGLDPDRDIMLVKEGFCWPALLFLVLWALWCRLWWVAFGLLVIEVALSGAVALLGLDPLSEAAISLGFAVIVGFVANDLKRWTLRRQGFVEVAVVVAETQNAARDAADQPPVRQAIEHRQLLGQPRRIEPEGKPVEFLFQPHRSVAAPARR